MLVGTNIYDSPAYKPLSNANNDVRSLKKLLDQCGFSISSLFNPTLNQFLDTLSSVKARIAGDTNSQFVLFMAGHGVQDRFTKGGYIIFRDTKAIPREDEFGRSGLSFSKAQELMRYFPSRQKLLTLDICHGGLACFFQDEILRSGPEIEADEMTNEEFVNKKSSRKASFNFTSGSGGSVSDGVPGYNSPFMWKLCDYLQKQFDRGKAVSLQELYSAMQRNKQEPCLGQNPETEPGGDFVLVPEKK